MQNTSAKNLFINLFEEISVGKVTLLHNNEEREFGDQALFQHDQRFPFASEGHVILKVKDPNFFSRVITEGNLGMGESYIEDEFEIIKGSLYELLFILLLNKIDKKLKLSLFSFIKILLLYFKNQVNGVSKNVPKHYDLGNDLFKSFLDSSLAYSCGYAKSETDTLEQIQQNKFARICEKLRLNNVESILDIGCGFGGLLIYACKHHGIKGVGITLSEEQMKLGNQFIEQEGLGENLKIILKDYRKMDGKFDRIVSVGMMEHIPRKDYRHYFAKISSLLKHKGLGLVHTIGCSGKTNTHDPFIQKYIFPGSRTPKLSEIAIKLEQNNLHILDVENIVRHYGYTANHWYKNFKENIHQLDSNKYDEYFLRMWEYYLACAIAAPFGTEAAVFQVLFTNDYLNRIPIKRV